MASSSTDVDGLEQLMDELVVICESKDLSIESLKAKIKLLPSHHTASAYVHHKYSSRPFFHAACMNKNITLEIIEYLLDAFPLVQNLPTAYFCPDGETTSYALHCACYNNNCPNEVIKLLVKNNSASPASLNQFCLVGDGVQCEDYDDYIRGLPLHYYLARESNVDIDTVKMLVEACPETLMAVGDMSAPTIHVALSNENINIDDLHDIIAFFLGQEESSQIIRMRGRWNMTPLHKICRKKGGLTLELFRHIFNAWPEAIRLGDDYSCLPIHWLCCNKQLDDIVSLDILRFMLSIDLTLLMETNENGDLPVHHAVAWKSTAFCKALIDAYPESVKIEADLGYLPIHVACRYGARDDSIDTIQYMLELHPESLRVGNNVGWLPIHNAAEGGNTKTVELLLMHDPSAASKETTGEKRQLPLHIAIDSYREHVDTVKALFDVYPDAILARNRNGKTPIDLARERRYSKVRSFLKTQVMYARKAQDLTTMTTLDENGWLPLHHALKDNAPLGSIKLLVKNPLAVRIADNKFAFPLHIACEFSSVQVVQYLVEAYSRSVDHCDDNKDSILHYACRGGNCEVVKYLLESHAHLVASATVNAKNELPIHLLCESSKDEDGDSESTEYIETIWLLLLANPEVVA